MTLTQLEYIVAVDREKNFHKAAQSCHVTQPTLSAMVKKLEEELDVVIFDRSKSPVAATRIGEAIIDQAKVALIESQKIGEIVLENREDISGDLRVGVIPTIAPYLLPLFLAQFTQKYPLVNLSLSELTTENCLAHLEEEKIDVAILATDEDQNRYFQDSIYDEKMYLYINPKHKLAQKTKISVDDLKAEEFWLLEEGHCLRNEIIKFCHLRKVEQKRPHGLDIKIGSLESLRYLVQKNFGYTLIPELATLRLAGIEKKNLRQLVSPEPIRTINFTTRRKYLRENLISALKSEVKTSVKNFVELV